MDLPTLQEIMGHANIKTTMKYVHPGPDHKRRAMDRFADTWSQTVTKVSHGVDEMASVGHGNRLSE
jgi:site-specific recombinase XerC